MSAIEWTDRTWPDRLVRRFWSNVDRRSRSECWPWMAGLFTNGYGQFRAGARKVKAHRAAFILTGGSLSAGLIVCHVCDNRICCNPAHLFAGTPADNAHDRDAKGRTRNGRTSLPGALNPSAKLRSFEVDEIRRLAAGGLTQREIAVRFSMSQSQIGNIVRGASWA